MEKKVYRVYHHENKVDGDSQPRVELLRSFKKFFLVQYQEGSFQFFFQISDNLVQKL